MAGRSVTHFTILIALVAFTTACGLGESVDDSLGLPGSPETQTNDLRLHAVTAADRTDPLGPEHDLDEPALWVNEANPIDSVIITTNKAHGDRKIGGLLTYNLDGTLLQELPGFYPNNVDILREFPVGNNAVDLVTTTDRSDERLRLLFFKMGNDEHSGNYRRLTDISGSNLKLAFEPYGQALYHDKDTNRWYVFVSQREAPFQIHQYEITEGTGEDTGKVVFADTEPVRIIEHRPSENGDFTVPLTRSEGMRVDGEKHALYVGEEDYGLHRYGAKPTDGSTGATVDRVATAKGNILPEVEGVAVIKTHNSEGYIVVSGQNGEELARYEVYDRQTNEHLHSFVIGPRSPEVPAATATDGIFGHFGYLNEDYPSGIFIAHSDNDEGEVSSLLLVQIDDIWPEDLQEERKSSMAGDDD